MGSEHGAKQSTADTKDSLVKTINAVTSKYDTIYVRMSVYTYITLYT